MKRSTLAVCLVAALLLMGAGSSFAAEAAARPADPAPQWSLAFQNDTPKALVLRDPVGKLTYCWYMVYRLKNTAKQPLPTSIRASLILTIKKNRTVFEDAPDVVARRHIQDKIVKRPLLGRDGIDSAKTGPLAPGQTREGVAVWRIGPDAAVFDKMTVSIRGLAATTALGRTGNVQKFRERVLNIHFDYVDSPWTAGKELRYDDEKWHVQVFQTTDAADTESPPVDSERMRKLLERLEKLREGIPGPPSGTAPDSSAAPGRSGMVSYARGIGEPAPKLVEELAQSAARARSVRASFVETLGVEQPQKSAGTAYLRSDKRFAIERTLRVGTRQLKELRVFDGDCLWIHTPTRDLGDTVRRWTAAKTKKQWHTVDGNAAVGFAAVVNPLRAWRLFGGSLVRLGAQQLEAEECHVFEARPGEALAPVLTGPLAGELLGRAAGARVRFWIGKRSGFQHRMRVYDTSGEVVAALECSALELDAHLPEARFAFQPPPGAQIIDMSSVIAANHGH